MTSHPRRRIYLMRHGAVDYFSAQGHALDADGVPLSAAGRAQADAAGQVFAAERVTLDSVLTSGLARAHETAQRVLAAAGQDALPGASDERLREIRFGDATGLPRAALEAAFSGAFDVGPGVDLEQHRFLGGESIAELLDRVLPAWDELLQRDDWRCLLLVLHGGVNRALLARVLTGRRGFIGHFEQAPGCINVIDVGSGDAVLRAVNLTPLQWLQRGESMTTMEKLLAQFLKSQAS